MIDSFSLTSVYIYHLFNSFKSRLDNCLSYSDLSRYINVNRFGLGLVINDRVPGDPLCVYRSIYNFSSLNWGLNDSLFDDRLAYNGPCYNRLRNNLSGNNRLTFDRLCLCNSRLAIVNLCGNKILTLKVSNKFSCLGGGLSSGLSSKCELSRDKLSFLIVD